MFDINEYKFNEAYNYLEIGGEAMIFHCHHYVINLQKTILDVEYIQGKLFLIGSAADAVYCQLTNLCDGLSIDESKKMAEDIYKTFGYGLVDLSSMDENGIELSTSNSFFSKTWQEKFGESDKPVDYYTSGFLAAVYAVLYKKELKNIYADQIECMTCGDDQNSFIVTLGKCNFDIYPKKHPIVFNKTPKLKIDWEYEDDITNAFLGAHAAMIGNEDGLIPAFGVYLVRNQSDYINRIQFEFVRHVTDVIGEYGVTLGGELLLESGRACGFFTYGGIMTSPEWETIVKPYLKTKEDWIKALMALVNTMGWGYHTAVELSKQKAVFRNYNDFEDLSYMRMYGKNDHPIHWVNSGGFTGLMQLIYNTDLTDSGEVVEPNEGFREMRRSIVGYKTKMTKGISCGDDFLEVEVYL